MAAQGKPNKFVIGAVLVVHAMIATLTWRDIKRRTPAQVRGPKAVWRTASAANTLGSAAYWLFGRRRGATLRAVRASD
jgi:hypothetical protein